MLLPRQCKGPWSEFLTWLWERRPVRHSDQGHLFGPLKEGLNLGFDPQNENLLLQRPHGRGRGAPPEETAPQRPVGETYTMAVSLVRHGGLVVVNTESKTQLLTF